MNAAHPEHVTRLHSKAAGIRDAFELALRFTQWAQDFHPYPSPAQVITRWQVSRPTAYRWLQAWKAAKGEG